VPLQVVQDQRHIPAAAQQFLAQGVLAHRTEVEQRFQDRELPRGHA
jgi:hypothetical protein